MQTAPVEAPAGIVVECRVDLGERHVQTVTSEVESERAYTAPEVQDRTSTITYGELQGFDLGERTLVICERVPPGQVVEVGVGLPVEVGDFFRYLGHGSVPGLCEL